MSEGSGGRLRMTKQMQSALVVLLGGSDAQMSALDICAASGIPHSSVHGILVRLREAGWVELRETGGRSRQDGGSRSHFYRLTERGALGARVALSRVVGKPWEAAQARANAASLLDQLIWRAAARLGGTTALADLPFSTRVRNALNRCLYRNMDDLVACGEAGLRDILHFGQSGVDEVQHVLERAIAEYEELPCSCRDTHRDHSGAQGFGACSRCTCRSFRPAVAMEGGRPVTNRGRFADAVAGAVETLGREHPIEETAIKPKIQGYLIRDGIRTLGDLARRDEIDLLNIRGLGDQSLVDLCEALEGVAAPHD
ncbi:DNA-directed RNA polymerase subunit alpha C-terminal domain-containing protein [Microbispora sp. NPDC049125]|uniref:DNA-directed RNA polymerase subunit alpha C-terminal domain-containing protein n=1 Tax=Microbispora sp. NPDC049125 TaxID=3154929 RepID=UPI00346693AC